ncbi:DUF1653 domain-containing protein [Candidatus Kaiserbacteria bacterium]|nr:DUF1653 domain-containing protein [Candidatus Kaiserbacteria bacterium]
MHMSTDRPQDMPAPGFYHHYKHDPAGPVNMYAYEVVGLGKHTEDDTYLILYRPLYVNEWLLPATYCVRPIESFMGDATKGGQAVPRFTRIMDREVLEELLRIRAELYGA